MKLRPHIDISDLKELISEGSARQAPFVVAVDGFGGSGKSSLCRELMKSLPDSGTVEIDDFIIFPHEPNVFDHDWPAFESKVLMRLKKDQMVITKTYDWQTLTSVAEHFQPVRNVMLIDGIGLLNPKYASYFDLRVWIDCPFDLSLQRAKERDKADGADHDELWDKVWGPGELRYFDAVRPDLLADVQFKAF